MKRYLATSLYNANNQVIRSVVYATAVTPAKLATLVDGSGNPTNVTLDSVRPTADAAKDRSVWNLYDNANRLVKTVDEDGFLTEFRYDGANRLTDTLRYANALNPANITASTLPTDAAVMPNTNPSLDRRPRTFYDADGKVRGTLDAAGYLSENQYDGAGRLIHTIGYATLTDSTHWNAGTLDQLRPAGNATQDSHSWLLYDGRSNVIATVNGEGYLTESLYDANGNLTQSIAYANQAKIAPTAITAGTLIGALRPDSDTADQVTTNTYTDLNQLATQTNAQGTVTRYTYDTVGQLIQTDLAWGSGEVAPCNPALTSRAD